MKLSDRSWVSATKVTQRGHRNTKITSDNDWVWLELNMNKNYGNTAGSAIYGSQKIWSEKPSNVLQLDSNPEPLSS